MKPYPAFPHRFHKVPRIALDRQQKICSIKSTFEASRSSSGLVRNDHFTWKSLRLSSWRGWDTTSLFSISITWSSLGSYSSLPWWPALPLWLACFYWEVLGCMSFEHRVKVIWKSSVSPQVNFAEYLLMASTVGDALVLHPWVLGCFGFILIVHPNSFLPFRQALTFLKNMPRLPWQPLVP